MHADRLDAQLQNIHSSLDSFLKDPAGPEYDQWKKAYDSDKRSKDVATDLDKHPELRAAMNKLVPEKIDYATFWRRYHFLKRVAEVEEDRRRDDARGILLCYRLVRLLAHFF